MNTLKTSILGGGLVVLLAACAGATAGGSAPTTAVAPVVTLSTSAVPPATEAPTTVAPTTTAVPTTESPTTAAPVVTVTNVVDGDTVDLSTGERVRIIGIDTPERGQCGFDEAAAAVAAMTSGKAVSVAPGARDDKDKYGRILRYIDVDSTDVGLTLIQEGLAIARYDSRDGYGHHPRQEAYVAADAATPSPCDAAATTTVPAASGGSDYYANCAAARAAGAAPLHEGSPGYRSALDGDHDGVACE